jgi:hypothetical protein
MVRRINTHSFGLTKIKQRLEPGYLPSADKSNKKFYRCDVLFGAPSANCQGTGICKIVAAANPDQSDVQVETGCRHTPALFALDASNGHLVMLLFPEFLCTKIQREHLRHGVLDMHEPCPIPENMRAFFGIQQEQLPADRYFLEPKMGYFQIHFSNGAPAERAG